MQLHNSIWRHFDIGVAIRYRTATRSFVRKATIIVTESEIARSFPFAVWNTHSLETGQAKWYVKGVNENTLGGLFGERAQGGDYCLSRNGCALR